MYIHAYLVFTIGYPNQRAKVLGSYRPLVKFSLFHKRVKFLNKGGRQLESSYPFNRTTFNGQIIMLPSYGQSTTAIYSDLIEQGLPRLDSQGLAFVKLRSPDLPSYFLLYRDTYSFRICKRGNQHRQKQEKHAQIVP